MLGLWLQACTKRNYLCVVFLQRRRRGACYTRTAALAERRYQGFTRGAGMRSSEYNPGYWKQRLCFRPPLPTLTIRATTTNNSLFRCHDDPVPGACKKSRRILPCTLQPCGTTCPPETSLVSSVRSCRSSTRNGLSWRTNRCDLLGDRI